MVRPVQPPSARPKDRHPLTITLPRIPRPIDTSAEEMFRRQSPWR